jgi:hypothetical protein
VGAKEEGEEKKRTKGYFFGFSPSQQTVTPGQINDAVVFLSNQMKKDDRI